MLQGLEGPPSECSICEGIKVVKEERIICHYFHLFPLYLHEVMAPDAMILVFLIISFKLTLTLLLHPHQEAL